MCQCSSDVKKFCFSFQHVELSGEEDDGPLDPRHVKRSRLMRRGLSKSRNAEKKFENCPLENRGASFLSASVILQVQSISHLEDMSLPQNVCFVV